MEKYKILVSCYACSPLRGSEPGMGWRFVKEISKHHEVHVITEKEKWENDIKQHLAEHPDLTTNLYFHFIAKKRNRKLRKIWPPSYYWFYKQWQKKAFQLAKKLNSEENFDLIHQLNMVGFREPGYLWKIDKPFVWGPIGGMQNTPWSLFSIFNLHGKLFYGGRNIFNSLQLQFLKRPKLAATRGNNSLIAATPDIKDTILKVWNKEAEIITEVGVEQNISNKINIIKENSKLNIVWSGQHTSGKALNILLKSLSKLPKNMNWSLHILGSGKETQRWKKLAKTLHINTNCKWYGWVPKLEAENVMKEGHLLCITSLKDLTSTVTLEAIALGLPVVCLNHCGFSHVINESCGIKIPVTTPENISIGFKTAIEKLYENEVLRQQLSQGAFLRAKSFLWEGKINKLNQVYTHLLNENSTNS